MLVFGTPCACDKKCNGSGQVLEYLEEMMESEILGTSVSYFSVVAWGTISRVLRVLAKIGSGVGDHLPSP